MVTITIPKSEYQKLTDKALRYDFLRQMLKEDVFSRPPTKNIRITLEEFRKTGKYNEKFLGTS